MSDIYDLLGSEEDGDCFSFDEAEPLLESIELFKERVKDEKLIDFYGIWSFDKSDFIDETVAFLFETFAIEVNFMDISELNVRLLSRDGFQKAVADSPYEVDENFPYKGKRIKSIEVDRFSESFQKYNLSGPIMPAGGDYFDAITVCFDNGGFILRGNDAVCDGYMTIKDCPFLPQLGELTCGECDRFENDMGCMGCLPDELAVRGGKACTGFIKKKGQICGYRPM